MRRLGVTLTGYKFTGAWQTALVVVGFTHGCVFTLYLLLVLLVRARMRWSFFTTVSILVAGLIPGGGYVVEAWALSGARVDGSGPGSRRRSNPPGDAWLASATVDKAGWSDRQMTFALARLRRSPGPHAADTKVRSSWQP